MSTEFVFVLFFIALFTSYFWGSKSCIAHILLLASSMHYCRRQNNWTVKWGGWQEGNQTLPRITVEKLKLSNPLSPYCMTRTWLSYLAAPPGASAHASAYAALPPSQCPSYHRRQIIDISGSMEDVSDLIVKWEPSAKAVVIISVQAIP